jgi:hypothetical protein
MKQSISFICIILFLVTITYSQPKDVKGWQKLKWGMSMDKVAELYNLPITQYDRNRLELEGKLLIDGDECKVIFKFDRKPRLEKVEVYLEQIVGIRDIHSRWINELTKKYGKPSVGSTPNKEEYGDTPTEEEKLFWYFPSTVISSNFFALSSLTLGTDISYLYLTYEKRTTSDDF